MNEFKPKSWAAPVQELVKEHQAWDDARTAPADIPTEPEEFSKGMVRRGVLNAETGEYGVNSKQKKITQDNAAGFSAKGKENYERTFGHA